MNRKTYVFAIPLIVITLMSGMVVHAGMTRYQSSPVIQVQGSDYQTAARLGYVAQSSSGDQMYLTVNGIAGAELVIDNLTAFVNQGGATSMAAVITSAASGTLPVQTLEFRFWTGSTAPTSDGSPGVLQCLYLVKSGTAVQSGTATAPMTAFSSSVVMVQLVFLASPSATSGETLTAQVALTAG